MPTRSDGDVPVSCSVTSSFKSLDGSAEFGRRLGEEETPWVETGVDSPVGLNAWFVE
jgi:hypothetical protein